MQLHVEFHVRPIDVRLLHCELISVVESLAPACPGPFRFVNSSSKQEFWTCRELALQPRENFHSLPQNFGLLRRICGWFCPEPGPEYLVGAQPVVEL